MGKAQHTVGMENDLVNYDFDSDDGNVKIPKKKVNNALCESCENGIWSGQLWQINSPPIFSKNLPNFQWWCLNIQIFNFFV